MVLPLKVVPFMTKNSTKSLNFFKKHLEVAQRHCVVLYIRNLVLLLLFIEHLIKIILVPFITSGSVLRLL